MKPDPQPARRTTHRQVQAPESVESLQQSAEAQFETPEALLRHDRAQTGVPDSLAQRLAAHAASVPSPAKPWWRRWF